MLTGQFLKLSSHLIIGVRAVSKAFVSRGSHSAGEQLMEFVWEHFAQSGRKPCLLLNYQGHSTTIVGASRNHETGSLELLVLDPSFSGALPRVWDVADKAQYEIGKLLPFRKLVQVANGMVAVVVEPTSPLSEEELEKCKTWAANRLDQSKMT